jgi:hypothetical protein
MAPAAGWSTPVICCIALEVSAIFQPAISPRPAAAITRCNAS